MCICIIKIQQRVYEIIKALESCSEYKDEQHIELRKKLSLLNHNFENLFYNFFFCLDWRYLYNLDTRLTLYDIYSKTGVRSFKKVYYPLKRMAVEGDITNIKDTYQDIMGLLNIGLQKYNIDKNHIKKGLYEFIRNFINKLVNVDYEITDYNQPYLDSSSVKNRFVIDVYYKFVSAYEISLLCNSYFKKSLEIGNIIISNTCFLHILLRHYEPLKVFTNYHPNPSFNKQIKNGVGNKVPITAFIDGEGGTSVISQDGTFVSTKLTYYKTYLHDDIVAIVDIAKHILPILSSNLRQDRSPNIVFFNNELYGVEFPKYIYKESGKIIVDSIYPLNSKWQKLYGISQKDYDYIINKQDIPSDYSIRIEQ